MSGKDYYKILGVDKSASKDEIKKKYRKLAMKYHPDQTKGDKAAETKFKDISEAYAVLSDDKKRKKYDTFGSDGFQRQFSQEDIFKGFDFGNVFREFGFGGGDFARGSDGGMRFSFGGGSPFGGRGQGRRRPVKGTNLEYEMPLTLQEIVNGSSKTVSLKHAGGDERISIKIPPVSDNFTNNSFCFSESVVGIFTWICTYKSPLPLLFICGRPCFGIRILVLCFVPGGIVRLISLLSTVDIRTAVPSTASTSLISFVRCRL